MQDLEEEKLASATSNALRSVAGFENYSGLLGDYEDHTAAVNKLVKRKKEVRDKIQAFKGEPNIF
jgi:hypothetical protein